jgi:hypothetical protein
MPGSLPIQCLAESRQNVLDHSRSQPRIDTYEERVVGDQVGVGQLTNHAVIDVLICRVAQEIAAKKIASLDTSGF